jgi:hypothetical protein
VSIHRQGRTILGARSLERWLSNLSRSPPDAIRRRDNTCEQNDGFLLSNIHYSRKTTLSRRDIRQTSHFMGLSRGDVLESLFDNASLNWIIIDSKHQHNDRELSLDFSFDQSSIRSEWTGGSCRQKLSIAVRGFMFSVRLVIGNCAAAKDRSFMCFTRNAFDDQSRPNLGPTFSRRCCGAVTTVFRRSCGAQPVRDCFDL